MGKEVSIFTNQTNTPAKIGKRTTALGEKLAKSGITNRRIQTNANGTFKRIINGEQVGKPIRGEINLIIVGALENVSRIYYRAKYDPEGEPTLPNCWSNEGDKPEPGVPDPQHENCADCPMNVVGSGDNGGRACRYQRRLAVLVEGDKQNDVYQFNVPAKSLFGKGHGNVHPFESYCRYLDHNGESPDTVVTNVSYNDDADSMELLFTPVRSVTEEEFDAVVACQSQPEVGLYTKITAAQADGVTKPPTAPKGKKKGKKKDKNTAAKVDDISDEDIEEPTKRPSKKKEETAEEVDEGLDDIINEWGGTDDE
jgi:hypothetical protein